LAARFRIAFVAACFSALAFTAPTHAAFPGANGKIAFTRCIERLGCDIYTINPDGTRLTRLTHTPRRRPTETRASWSPDGKKLAFDSLPDIWTVDANGTHLKNLTADSFSGGAREATWSPDGAKIAFEGDVASDVDQICVMNSDGSDVQVLTNAPGFNLPGSYSPDGGQIAFTTTRSGTGYEVWVMNADGSDQRSLVGGVLPDWSPDGASILFRGSDDLYVFDIQSGRSRRLTIGAHVFRSAWSPDGTKVVFSQPDFKGGFNLFVVNADGSDVTQITHDGNNDNPDWQPLPVEPRL
jgi:TolB protein